MSKILTLSDFCFSFLNEMVGQDVFKGLFNENDLNYILLLYLLRVCIFYLFGFMFNSFIVEYSMPIEEYIKHKHIF